jgi:hypothetical protein
MPEIGNPAAIRETVTQAYRGTFSFICGTTAYAVNDAVGPGGAAAALEFPNTGPRGAEVMITSVWLRIDAAALVTNGGNEGGYRLALFNVTPPSALADSGAWGLPSDDRDAFLGFVEIGTPAAQGASGASLWVENNGLLKQVTLLGTGLWGYLLSNAAYTPSARVFAGGIKTLLV